MNLCLQKNRYDNGYVLSISMAVASCCCDCDDVVCCSQFETDWRRVGRRSRRVPDKVACVALKSTTMNSQVWYHHRETIYVVIEHKWPYYSSLCFFTHATLCYGPVTLSLSIASQYCIEMAEWIELDFLYLSFPRRNIHCVLKKLGNLSKYGYFPLQLWT